MTKKEKKRDAGILKNFSVWFPIFFFFSPADDAPRGEWQPTTTTWNMRLRVHPSLLLCIRFSPSGFFGKHGSPPPNRAHGVGSWVLRYLVSKREGEVGPVAVGWGARGSERCGSRRKRSGLLDYPPLPSSTAPRNRAVHAAVSTRCDREKPFDIADDHLHVQTRAHTAEPVAGKYQALIRKASFGT